MLRILAFLPLLQFSSTAFTPAGNPAPLSCPAVTDLHKTSGTTTTFSCAWNTPDNSAVEYKVWYVRTQGDYFSGYFYTTSKSYTFSGLTCGHYTFYVQAVCSGETSEFVGIEDVICA